MTHKLFEVNEKQKSMEPFEGQEWKPKELEIEGYIISAKDDDDILNTSLFGEELLLIENQITIRSHRERKRADILAVDKAGNAVIIELKRDAGALGVETQALQYLAQFSTLKGTKFIKEFSKGNEKLGDKLRSFVGNDYSIDNINKNSRIILLARNFDQTLYSLGDWLFTKGVAFRCIKYLPVEIEGKRFLSFSTSFDRSSASLLPLAFSSSSVTRYPGYFWHNIGGGGQEWWNILQDRNQISAGFEGEPGDQGEAILKSYIKGDTIFAYASGYGAIGYGVIEDPESYKLLKSSDRPDNAKHWHLHRLGIKWVSLSRDLKDAISPSELRKDFDIYHPVGTHASIDPAKAEKLKEEIKRQFGIIEIKKSSKTG